MAFTNWFLIKRITIMTHHSELMSHNESIWLRCPTTRFFHKSIKKIPYFDKSYWWTSNIVPTLGTVSLSYNFQFVHITKPWIGYFYCFFSDSFFSRLAHQIVSSRKNQLREKYYSSRFMLSASQPVNAESYTYITNYSQYYKLNEYDWLQRVSDVSNLSTVPVQGNITQYCLKFPYVDLLLSKVSDDAPHAKLNAFHPQWEIFLQWKKIMKKYYFRNKNWHNKHSIVKVTNLKKL